MTFEDYTKVMSEKTESELLNALVITFDVRQDNHGNMLRAKQNGNIKEAAFWKHEVQAMDERASWLYDRLSEKLTKG